MKIRTPVILTVISLFFLLPLKWFNVLESIGEDVSFAVSDNVFLTILAAVLVVVVFCSMTAKGARIRVNTKKSAIMGFVMLIAAAVLALEAIVSYMSYSISQSVLYQTSSLVYNSIEIYSHAFQSNFNIDLPAPMLVSALIFSGQKGLYYCIACVVGLIGFLLMSYDFFGGKNFFRNKPILAILPTIWGVVRIACSYMFYTTIADLGVCVLDILFMCSTLIFLFAQARLFADINAYKSVRVATASGLCSIVFSMCSNGIRYIIMMTGREDFLTDLNTPNMSDSIITVMIAAYIIYIIAPRAHKPVEPDDVCSNASIVTPPSTENVHQISNQPHLFIHSEQSVSSSVLEDAIHPVPDTPTEQLQDDYYGDVDKHGRRIDLPVQMNARGTLAPNIYRLRKASPLSPNVHINTRLR